MPDSPRGDGDKERVAGLVAKVSSTRLKRALGLRRGAAEGSCGAQRARASSASCATVFQLRVVATTPSFFSNQALLILVRPYPPGQDT